MVITRTSRKYIEALADLATELGQSDLLAPQLERLEAAVAENPALLRLLGHPEVALEEKLEALFSVLGEPPHELVGDFCRLLLERREPRVLVGIAQVYCTILDERAGVTLAQVEAARPLTEEQQNRLKAALSALAGGPVRLEMLTVPELIGGARVLLGDRMIDGSLAGRLDRLAQSSLQTR